MQQLGSAAAWQRLIKTIGDGHAKILVAVHVGPCFEGLFESGSFGEFRKASPEGEAELELPIPGMLLTTKTCRTRSTQRGAPRHDCGAWDRAKLPLSAVLQTDCITLPASPSLLISANNPHCAARIARLSRSVESLG